MKAYKAFDKNMQCRGFQYAETCAVMLIIVVTVSAIDVVSARIRKALI